MSTVLVLGAGGTVGMAYHAGVLKALVDRGVDAGAADLIIGTSAGSVVGALLRTGHSAEDLWLASQGDHPLLAQDLHERRRATRRKGWRTGPGLARRVLGAGWVVGRSVVRWPPVWIPDFLGRIYPGGLASTTEMRAQLAQRLGEDWPEEPLWLCTIDIHSGRRVVLGRKGPSSLPLPDAVRASTAIPGVFPPIRHGNRVLVDGGAYSTTNADLADRIDPHTVVISAPMAIDPADAPTHLERFGRRLPSWWLQAEVADLEEQGIEVVILRPSAAEVRRHGLDLMRVSGTEELARMARDSAEQILEGVDGLRWPSAAR